MNIYQSSSKVFLQDEFWKNFSDSLESMRKNEQIFVGLSGGSSLDIFYEVIRFRYSEIDSDIRVKIFFAFLDERIVPIAHPDRNEFQLRAKFLSNLLEESLIYDDQIVSVDMDSSDICDDYSLQVPRIDIGLFGVGPEGHIASLFPHHPLLLSPLGGFLEILDSPKPPSHRITISPRMIGDMSYVSIAFMKGKEEAFVNFQDEGL